MLAKFPKNAQSPFYTNNRASNYISTSCPHSFVNISSILYSCPFFKDRGEPPRIGRSRLSKITIRIHPFLIFLFPLHLEIYSQVSPCFSDSRITTFNQ